VNTSEPPRPHPLTCVVESRATLLPISDRARPSESPLGVPAPCCVSFSFSPAGGLAWVDSLSHTRCSYITETLTKSCPWIEIIRPGPCTPTYMYPRMASSPNTQKTDRRCEPLPQGISTPFATAWAMSFSSNAFKRTILPSQNSLILYCLLRAFLAHTRNIVSDIRQSPTAYPTASIEPF
jgi:hypothetical protein